MKTPTKSKQVSKVKTMTRLEAANKINNWRCTSKIDNDDMP